MSNWRILNNTYIYDGSIEGLFSVISYTLELKVMPNNIISEEKYIDNLLEIPLFIDTSKEKANNLIAKIKSISNFSLYNIYTSFLSGNNNKDFIILKYLLSLLKYGKNFDYMKNNEVLIAMNDISKKVVREAHKLKGFVRFKEISNGILYSEIEPENNVIEVLAKHFKERLKNDFWVINDKKRNIMVLYNKKEYIIVNSNNSKIKEILKNDKEELYQVLWKDYFKTMAIKERENLKVQMNFMPKKYWKYLIEKEGEKI